MGQRPALFYFGFGPKIGLGHAVRCAALADALRLDGWRCGLLSTDTQALPRFVANSFDGDTSGKVEVLVVDHYEPDLTLIEQWRSRCVRILQIHDGGATPLFGDMVVNQNADAARQPLHGPAYALVRQAFPERRPRAKAASERGPVTRVLVMPGATDVAGLCKALAVRQSRSGPHYTFILSRLAPDFTEVSRLASASDGQAALVADATAAQVAELMLEHDLLIGNGGSGNWERCTLGLPSITVVMADNQRGNADALSKDGATILAGHFCDAALMSTIDGVVHAPAELLRRLSEKSFAVTDGLGAYRVAAALAPNTNRKGERIALRPAMPDDSERIFRWQQQPEIRRHSPESRGVSREEHVDWFAAKLRDHRCIFNIVLADGAEVGVVRLDYREMVQGRPCYELSIYVDPTRYRQGIASAALQATRRLTPFAWRKAFVHERNAPSLALFASQGYRKDGPFLYDPALC